MENKEVEKINTKHYFGCQKCEKKLGIIEVGSGTDFLGFSGKQKLLYCENKECEKYGDLTVIGIKKEE